MIKELFFKLVDTILLFKKDGDLETGEYTDGTKYTTYRKGGTKYTCVGDKQTPRAGFYLPLKEATCEGQDVTKVFKHFAGPKCVHVPDTGYIFRQPKTKLLIQYSWPGFQIKLIRVFKKGESKKITTVNLINQVSEYGAK